MPAQSPLFCIHRKTTKMTDNHGTSVSKTIALVAHDHRKKDLTEWVEYNYLHLLNHQLICTGTTGTLVDRTIHSCLKEGEKLKFDII